MNSEPVSCPITEADPVVDNYHGIEVVDPYRWLEDQESPRTRDWITRQTAYARRHLDTLPHREQIRKRVEQLLAVESISSVRYRNGRCLFIRRGPNDEQAKLYIRETFHGEDRLLLDPVVFDSSHTTSLSILDVTRDGRFVALGVRAGGYGGRAVRVMDVERGSVLEDALPVGAVRGFSFSEDGTAFLYVLEHLPRGEHAKEAKLHVMGNSVRQDRIVFSAGSGNNIRLLSHLVPEINIAVHRVMKQDGNRVLSSAFLQDLNPRGRPLLQLWEETPHNIDIRVGGGRLWWRFENGPIMSTALLEPDLKRPRVVLPREHCAMAHWSVGCGWLILHTVENFRSVVRIWDAHGEFFRELPQPGPGSVAVLDATDSHVFYLWESFSTPPAVYIHHLRHSTTELFSLVPSRQSQDIVTRRVWVSAQDGMHVPLTILGKAEAFVHGAAPTLLTGYGASGRSLTPKYSQLATILIENGGLFALAHIRGGGELGQHWKDAGARHNRPTAFADFISCGEYLIHEGLTHSSRLAIAGGSNSGLLVGAAMTIRPHLFRCVICMAPILDMLRYHLFQNTQFYVKDVGSSEDPVDFPVLASYSPYHRIRDGECYPAVLLVAGDADTRCDSMHARKFVARLQAASGSRRPVLLDYSEIRGHWPVLPLSFRVNALTDRISFLLAQLSVAEGNC